MSVSYKGKRKLTYKGKEYIWSVHKEFHITAVDRSEMYEFPLRPKDDEEHQRLKEYLGIDFDIPEAITPSFVVKVIEWEQRRKNEKGSLK